MAINLTLSTAEFWLHVYAWFLDNFNGNMGAISSVSTFSLTLDTKRLTQRLVCYKEDLSTADQCRWCMVSYFALSAQWQLAHHWLNSPRCTTSSMVLCYPDLTFQRAPTSGGQYHWVSLLAPTSASIQLSWVTGWISVLAWIAATGVGLGFLENNEGTDKSTRLLRFSVAYLSRVS
jgi:hypothetical protein